MNNWENTKAGKSKSFHGLDVWKKAHAWIPGGYRLTEYFPKHELFGLTSQLRRAAVSVPANLTEGFSRKGTADKARFYHIAQGPLEECRYYLILARDLGYANTQQLASDLDEIGRLLDSYLRARLAAS
jgi:four helix bundle protein